MFEFKKNSQEFNIRCQFQGKMAGGLIRIMTCALLLGVATSQFELEPTGESLKPATHVVYSIEYDTLLYGRVSSHTSMGYASFH